MTFGQNDFAYSILEERAHRPYPIPDGPWIMTQTWHDLLFAHWPVDAKELRPKVPAGVELDLFDGQAYVGVIPFHMTNVAPRGVPAVPLMSAFPELNVRTYVHMNNHPGVYFFSLDAGSSLAVGAARTMFSLPYYSAKMKVHQEKDGTISYSSRRTSADAPSAEFVAHYRPVGDVKPAARGTLEYFLTERYCLYTVDSSSRPYRVEIHHPPWPLQAAEAEIATNTMADAVGIRLPSMAPLLHFSRRQDMVNWGLTRVT